MAKQHFSFQSSDAVSFESLQKLKSENPQSYFLYHGGLEIVDGKTVIDLNRLGTQQNKGNKTYGGFYLTDGSAIASFGKGEKVDWAEQYARARNGNLHAFLIKEPRVLDCRAELSDEDSSILDGIRNIDRVSRGSEKSYLKNMI